MKKMFILILALAMMTLSVAALADGNNTTSGGMPPMQARGGNPMGMGQPPQGMQGMNGRPGQMPGMNASEMIDFDAMVTKGIISQETCDRIKAYMEEHKPADLPQMNGTQGAGMPEMNGEKPTDLPEMNGERPSDLPEMNGEKPADLPEMNGTQPAEGGAPVMGGLLADLLKDGIITQSEYDAILSDM